MRKGAWSRTPLQRSPFWSRLSSVIFSKRGSEDRSHIIAVIRDCVEIVAIVAAGIWAFYIFVYENRIVPSLAQPEVNFTASMQKVSRHNGLIGVLMQARAKNVGTVHVHFIGVAASVAGQTIASSARPRALDVKDNSIDVLVFADPSRLVPVYESGYVTKLGDRSATKDLTLDPGSEVVISDTIIYVPEHRFDRLRVFLCMRYSREDKEVPTQLYVDSDGRPHFRGNGAEDSDVNTFASTVASLDLNGP
jgi:hypothetical protein